MTGCWAPAQSPTLFSTEPAMPLAEPRRQHNSQRSPARARFADGHVPHRVARHSPDSPSRISYRCCDGRIRASVNALCRPLQASGSQRTLESAARPELTRPKPCTLQSRGSCHRGRASLRVPK